MDYFLQVKKTVKKRVALIYQNINTFLIRYLLFLQCKAQIYIVIKYAYSH